MDDGFLLDLSVTILVETAVLIAAVLVLPPDRRPRLSRILFAGFFASSWSLPYLWFFIPRLVSGKAYLPVGECLVISGEAVVLRFILGLPYPQCFGLSTLCNLASILAGMLLVELGG